MPPSITSLYPLCQVWAKTSFTKGGASTLKLVALSSPLSVANSINIIIWLGDISDQTATISCGYLSELTAFCGFSNTRAVAQIMSQPSGEGLKGHYRKCYNLLKTESELSAFLTISRGVVKDRKLRPPARRDGRSKELMISAQRRDAKVSYDPRK
jgi:hypothetical protein